jgi:hypothetical protein
MTVHLKRAAMKALEGISGFRGLEVEGRKLIVYVVSSADAAALPSYMYGLRVQAVVAEELAERRLATRISGVFRAGTAKPVKAGNE